MIPRFFNSLRPTHPVIAGAVVAGLSSGALAQTGPNDEDHSSARLIASKTALVAGTTNSLEVVFGVDQGWHLYWDGQNDTGFPPDLAIEWPEGWELRETYLPIPKRHVAAGDLLDHVLEGNPVFWLSVYIPDDAAGADVSLTGKASWLVCDEACMLDDESLSLTVPVVPHGTKVEWNPETAIGPTRWDSFPEPSKLAIPTWIDAAWIGDEVKLRVTGQDHDVWEPGTVLEYYPTAGSARVENLLAGGRSETGDMTLRIGDGEAEGTPALRGLIALIRPNGDRTAMWITMDRPDPLSQTKKNPAKKSP
ncbi:MAG: DsbC/DsbD-like thiol-disulfide interchange protein [Phycisphaerales bacterium]